MPLDLVISSVHSGLYLCFFHAALDKDPRFNNRMDSIWTNLCHTPVFNEHHKLKLESRLKAWSMASPAPFQTFSIPQRIFQLLGQTHESVNNLDLNNIIISWPPSDGSTGECSYNPSDFTQLMSEISLNPSNAKHLSNAQTSCTRRFKAKHSKRINNSLFSIRSMFVPYGEIIFACFLIESEYPLSKTLTNTRNSTDMFPSLTATSIPNNVNYSNGKSNDQQFLYNDVPLANTPSQKLFSNQTYTYPSFITNSNANSNVSVNNWNNGQLNDVKLPSNKLTMEYDPNSLQKSPPLSTTTPTLPTTPIPPTINNQLKKETSNKMCCVTCHTEKSPEWRRGPNGQKNLCNACGLRYARAVNKQENNTQSKRRKSDTKTNSKNKNSNIKQSTINSPSSQNNLYNTSSINEFTTTLTSQFPTPIEPFPNTQNHTQTLGNQQHTYFPYQFKPSPLINSLEVNVNGNTDNNGNKFTYPFNHQRILHQPPMPFHFDPSVLSNSDHHLPPLLTQPSHPHPNPNPSSNPTNNNDVNPTFDSIQHFDNQPFLP